MRHAVIAALALLSACGAKSDGGETGSTASPDVTGSTSTTDSSGDAGTTVSSGDAGSTVIPDGTTSSAGTTLATGDCGSFTTEESCLDPCSWASFSTYLDASTSCEPGAPVSLCVYVSGDVATGCGIRAGCDDPWGYIEVDSTRAMATYCGGTPPEGWTQCSDEAISGAIPECACACPGGGSSGGT